ncbi:MAG: polysaccharide deacetylase family protein [Acidimicrobiales bacterium]
MQTRDDPAEGAAARPRSLDTARRRARARAAPGLRGLAGVLAGSVQCARTADQVVALTFDDGPDPCATPGVLAALERHGAKATFFVLTAAAEAHPELVGRMLAAGHEVGLHGGEHVPLGRASLRRSADVVWRGHRRLTRITGTPARWFRPPCGSQNLRSYAVARAAGMQVVSWTADAADWRPLDLDACVARAAAGLAPGAIVLLHDRPQPEGACVPGELADRVLEATAARGLRAVALGEMLRGRPAVRAAWFKPR